MRTSAIKKRTTLAIAMLKCVIYNKWDKETKEARIQAAINLARIYLNEIEEMLPSKNQIK
jgi:hypothetical protein